MELLGAILKDVSRSFYVSIRLLPAKLRRPIGLAYLLARATDSIADTTKIPAAVRAESLRNLAAVIQENGAAAAIVDSFAPLQTNESERKLIQSLPDCFAELRKLDVADQKDVRDVLSTINRGQTLDIERPTLATAAELEEYTYLVAGCVGEFWTRVCFRHLEKFSERSQPEMLEIGKRYGMGLQLINILRDAGTDLQNGRCYFPEEELRNAGISSLQILEQPDRFMSIFHKWLGEAEGGLEAGMQDVDADRGRRVRGATALPALIGAKTLSLLKTAGASVLREKIKVPRSDMRAMIGTVAITLADKDRLQRMFRDSL